MISPLMTLEHSMRLFYSLLALICARAFRRLGGKTGLVPVGMGLNIQMMENVRIDGGRIRLDQRVRSMM